MFKQHNISDLARSIQLRERSCIDLAHETIRAHHAAEESIRAWVSFDEQIIEAAANAIDREIAAGANLGPLCGVPFGAKDIFNTKAFPTQMGSELWSGFRPGNNARVVDSLLNAGALMAGKTVTAEFAVHHLNQTLNPHDAARTPGTSSSGSAAAVAAGVVPFALGTQTAGSIVRPASFCGVWGMKPSFGLVPRTGVLKTTDSLDTIGFLAAHPGSLRAILDCIRVKGPDYPFVFRHIDSVPKTPVAGKTRRMGLVKTYTWNGAENYVKTGVLDLAQSISKAPGWTVEELTLPDVCATAHQVHETIYNKSLAYYFEREAQQGERISPVMSEMIERGRAISTQQFRTALRNQEEITRAIDSVMRPFHLVLSIGTSSAAPLRGVTELPDPSLIWTLGHLPTVAVPAFMSPEGLPFGCQLIAAKYGDYQLLDGLEELLADGVIQQPELTRQAEKPAAR